MGATLIPPVGGIAGERPRTRSGEPSAPDAQVSSPGQQLSECDRPDFAGSGSFLDAAEAIITADTADHAEVLRRLLDLIRAYREAESS